MNKNTLLAVGFFAVLLLVFFATREKKVEVGIQRLTIGKIDRTKVTGIEISGAHNAVLRKNGDAWQVKDAKKADVFYPADESQVSAVFDALDAFKSSQVVTQNASRHGELEVDAAKGLRLKVVSDKGAMVDIVLGKQSQQGGTYVRKGDSEPVFTAEGGLVWSVRKEAKAWRRHGLLATKTEDVNELTIEHADGERLTLSRQDKTWKLPSDFDLPKGFRFDSGAGERIVQQLTGLTAQDFLDEPGALETLGLKPASRVIRAKTQDGKSVSVLFGKMAAESEVALINQLNGQFSSLDANADGKISQDEVVKGEAHPSADVKAVSVALKDGSKFSQMDLGGVLGGTGDGAISRDDVSSAQKAVSLVPAMVEGSSQVYQVARQTAQNLTARLDALRDLSLMSIASEDVQKIEIAFKATKVAVARENEAWKVVEPKRLPEGFELGANQATLQVNLVRTLKAHRIAKGVKPAQTGFDRPTMTVTLFGKEGTTQKLVFGREFRAADGNTEVYVKGAVDNETYVLPVFARNRLEQGIELFRQQRSSMSGLQNLPPDIRAKLEAQFGQQFAQ